MKRSFAVLICLLLAFTVSQPHRTEAASELEKIRSEIKKLQQKMNDVDANLKKVQQDKQIVLNQKEVTMEQINELSAHIHSLEEELKLVDGRIAESEESLLQAGQELEDTKARIEERGELLDARVRLMYTNGFVSYLDVLLSATSFSDFLDRFDSLQSILAQDKAILEAHKADKELIEQKKAQIEAELAGLQELYSKKEDYYNLLVDKEKEKEVMILQYNRQIEALDQRAEELEEISEEQEKQLMELARKEKAAIEAEKKRKNTVYYTGGKLGMPIKDYKYVSSKFGPRTHPVTGQKGKQHNGIDFAAASGTDIFAAESGTVIVAQSMSGYGNTVIIDHGNGLWTLYGHIRKGGIKVKAGEVVKKGQKIAEVGSTGVSTGPHLHFEVRLNEKPVDPENYLR
ncbi:Membrane proteins related to metalloendopeptidases [Thermobacillus xylanilyticus]|uniref:Membrane proteins related to metalloendopeptidases n=1 Tax=Thermobacillus xylanilyticus TaxID=76633 RepID=A0ABM8V5H2_THEXY|nr:peptidoglycan DD-metalloendopeptidase family protein [Thermobacillus xylanilyticus]CAG5088609.1 Membrane proteins related to metalloendopeptidases [Thermobacillus xylanilyticus]